MSQHSNPKKQFHGFASPQLRTKSPKVIQRSITPGRKSPFQLLSKKPKTEKELDLEDEAEFLKYVKQREVDKQHYLLIKSVHYQKPGKKPKKKEKEIETDNLNKIVESIDQLPEDVQQIVKGMKIDEEELMKHFEILLNIVTFMEKQKPRRK
jgi:hypothetical protein